MDIVSPRPIAHRDGKTWPIGPYLNQCHDNTHIGISTFCPLDLMFTEWCSIMATVWIHTDCGCAKTVVEQFMNMMDRAPAPAAASAEIIFAKHAKHEPLPTYDIVVIKGFERLSTSKHS